MSSKWFSFLGTFSTTHCHHTCVSSFRRATRGTRRASRRLERSEMNSTRLEGGAQWPDSDLDEFAPDVDCEGRLPHDPNRMNQCVGCKGAEAGSLHTLR